jgi:pimeloyl-ACP methyl ester carboxylesterase/ribosomal protein S18 acetylase RimI-like enzyme
MNNEDRITVRTIKADVLSVAYQEYGQAEGWPCVLGHGFPYDVHAYADVAPILAHAGARVIVPYLRGFGPTGFLHADTPRSGEQAALGADLRALMDALRIERAALGGYDWGGRAACVVSALWPERVTALVSGNSYNIQDIAHAMDPAPPSEEAAFWYQYYFHSERGRRGLMKDRRGLARFLWRMWSPTWSFDEATFERTAGAFDNPDFVEIVVHSYRHRYGLVPGDPAYARIEAALATQPPIAVPTITIDGDADGVNPGTAHHADKFAGPHEHRMCRGGGHNLPQERPEEFARAVLDARAMALASAREVGPSRLSSPNRDRAAYAAVSASQNGKGVEIRDARSEEFDAVGRLMVEAYSSLDGFPKQDAQPAYFDTLKRIGEQAKKPGVRVLVACKDSALLGAVVYFSDMSQYGSGGAARLERNASGFRFLAVEPKAQRRGVAKALVERCVETAAANGHRCVIIHSTAAMRIARALYEKRGFRRAPDLDILQGGLKISGFRLML